MRPQGSLKFAKAGHQRGKGLRLVLLEALLVDIDESALRPAFGGTSAISESACMDWSAFS